MPFPARIDADQLGAQALAAVEAAGWDSWSLRDVAAAVGVTPNALYRYVDGKAGLHVAIGAAAARELRSALTAVALPADPVEAAVALSLAYLSFALARPAAYQAVMTAKPDLDHPMVVQWTQLWRFLVERMAEAAPEAADAATFALWAFLHGRVEVSRGPAKVGPLEGAADAVRALVRGFQAAGSLPSPVPEALRDPE